MQSKQVRQYGLPSLMMYLWPPSCRSHSKQAKCFMCQALPSASVHSSDKIICVKGKNRKLTPHIIFKAGFAADKWNTASRLHFCTHFVARGATWFHRFGVVSSAIEFALLVKVDQVDQELLAS